MSVLYSLGVLFVIVGLGLVGLSAWYFITGLRTLELEQNQGHFFQSIFKRY